MSANERPTPADADWQRRLSEVMELMRESSRHIDPQAMVAAYNRRLANILPVERFIAISRRDLDPPKYRITRYSGWKENINPWKQKDRLPVLEGGLLGELLYAGQPRIIDDLQVADDDPAAEYLAGQRSLSAIPHLDRGQVLNMVISTHRAPAAVDKQRFPDTVWMSILFGRSTHNLVLAEQLRESYELIDRELQIVGDIQRSLLPAQLPEIRTLKLAAHYQTSRRAGGDYYDFFPLEGGRWGVLIADVSGHGTPAAVMMAITHSIAHLYRGPAAQPSDLLDFLSRQLVARYAQPVGSFVTAVYAIYDPNSRELVYSSAGHNPPRLKSATSGTIESLDGARSLPLGVAPDAIYENAVVHLQPGDQLVFYTDGITEATDATNQLFGVARLDAALAADHETANQVVAAILDSVAQFTSGQPAADDRTLVVATVS